MLTLTKVSRILFFGFISLLLSCRSVKTDQEKVKTKVREANTAVLSAEIKSDDIDHTVRVERFTTLTLEAQEGENDITIETPEGKTTISGVKKVTLSNATAQKETRKENRTVKRVDETKKDRFESSTNRRTKEKQTKGGGSGWAYLSVSVVFLALLLYGLKKTQNLPTNILSSIINLFKHGRKQQ